MTTDTIDTIRFEVPGRPLPQPRHQQRIIAKVPELPEGWQEMEAEELAKIVRKKVLADAFVTHYTPADAPIHEYMNRVKQAYVDAQWQTFECPIALCVAYIFPRTQNQIWKTKPMPRLRHAKRPDSDNITKGVKDALNGVAWKDDSQVCDERYVKRIAAGDEQARTIVWIKPLSETVDETSAFM